MMKSSVTLLLAVLCLTAATTHAQFYSPYYGYPGFVGGGWGGPQWGPSWGQGRGLAFLGSAALLGSRNPLGRIVGAAGLGGLLFG